MTTTLTVDEQKAALLDTILENPVYQPDSGFVALLRGGLCRLPLSVLADLDLLITIKTEHAAGPLPEPCPKCGGSGGGPEPATACSPCNGTGYAPTRW
jgi:hypothetical protein